MQVGPKTENVKNIFTYRLHWVVLRVFIIMKRVFSCFKFELLGLQPLFRPDGSWEASTGHAGQPGPKTPPNQRKTGQRFFLDFTVKNITDRQATLNSWLFKVPHSSTDQYKNSFFFPYHYQLEPPQWRPGEGPHTWGLQMTDCHPKHHVTLGCAIPSHHIKIRSSHVGSFLTNGEQQRFRLWISQHFCYAFQLVLNISQSENGSTHGPAFFQHLFYQTGPELWAKNYCQCIYISPPSYQMSLRKWQHP